MSDEQKRSVGRPKNHTLNEWITIRVPEPVKQALQQEADFFKVGVATIVQETLKQARPDLPWDISYERLAGLPGTDDQAGDPAEPSAEPGEAQAEEANTKD